MPSSCTNLATHAARLRDAQRAFFLAWKAIESGDRGTLAEARAAQRELEGAHRDIERILYTAWTPKALERVERKRNLRHTVTLEAEPDDKMVSDLNILSDGKLLVTYVRPLGKHGIQGRVVSRFVEHKYDMRYLDVFYWKANIRHSVLCPDNTLIAISGRSILRVDLNESPERVSFLPKSGGKYLTLHAHFDGRIFAGDTKGQMNIFTPRNDGTYSIETWKAHQRRVSGMHVFSDGSCVTFAEDSILKYWRQVGDEENGRHWESQELHRGDFPNYYTAMHASVDGRLAVGTIFRGIDVYDQRQDGSLAYACRMNTTDTPMALQVLPDHRIVVLHVDTHVGVLEPNANGVVYWYKERTDLMDTHRSSFGSINVGEDGVIAVTTGGSSIYIVDGNSVSESPKK